jgi:flavin reductase (DIM6/NTAB) family NADH-FMN oxidoreductase RutF/DNA-binding MarR family transcriptional regulator
MTANSFSSVSLSPPLVLWSVKRTSQSFEAFRDAPHFAINILATDQLALSRHFGKSGDDKFTGIPWNPGISGAPLLHGVAATIECRRVLEYEGGDHLIILGHVERFTRYDRDVLLFVQGRYGVVRDHPELAAKLDPDADLSNAQGPTNELMAGLMYRAYGALSTVMERTQRKEGFDPVQGRILGAIATYPDRTIDTLMPELYLGATIAENCISELISNGLVLMSARGELSLSDQGEARLKRLSDEIRLRETEQLDGLSAEDLAAARRVFRHLISQGRANRSRS